MIEPDDRGLTLGDGFTSRGVATMRSSVIATTPRRSGRRSRWHHRDGHRNRATRVGSRRRRRVIEVYAAAGMESPDISILPDQFLNRLVKDSRRGVDALLRLPADHLDARSRYKSVLRNPALNECSRGEMPTEEPRRACVVERPAFMLIGG